MKTAAEIGNAEAMLKLGDLNKNGWGGFAIAKNYKEARGWYKKAADAWGMYNLGDLYKNGLGVAKDYKEARYWFEKARRAGNPDSMYGLGDLYKIGGYGVDQDFGQAREWYQDAGSAWGMYDLAQVYEYGLGVPKKPPKPAHGTREPLKRARSRQKQWLKKLSSVCADFDP